MNPVNAKIMIPKLSFLNGFLFMVYTSLWLAKTEIPLFLLRKIVHEDGHNMT
jgi:hypothetical protein